MTSWPLYVFYIALLGSPLLFFVVTKPHYEKSAAPPVLPGSSKPVFKHSARHNARRRLTTNDHSLVATAPPTQAGAPT